MKKNVKVRGDNYTVIAVYDQSHLGSKFFGKKKYMLRRDDGELFKVYGKSISHNSRVFALEPWEQEEM